MWHDLWLRQLSNLIRHGETVGPRGKGTRELLNQQLLIEDSARCLIDVPARKLNYRFAVAEWLWMMFGRSDVATIAQYNSQLMHYSDDGVWFTGAYGPHLCGQWYRALTKLRQDTWTRQAVIEIPRPRHLNTKDEPCTLSLHFLARWGHLHCIATMRSSDAWLGLPYDVFNFAMIQNCLAGQLGLQRGWLSMNLGSSHLYDEHVDAAETLLRDYRRDDATILEMPPLSGRPPAWLEDVLVHRENAVNGHRLALRWSKTDEWAPFADALLASTSDRARDVLRASHNALRATR
jgi:thymidylate synthase